jgi:hypothetical protein
MKISIRIISLVFLSLGYAACAGPTINVARLSGENYSPVAPDKVEVVATGSLKRSYKEIGIFDVEEGPGSQTYDEMIQALRVRAGAMGADAVLIDTSTKNQGMLPIGGMWVAASGKFIKAVAVRWTDR